MKPDIAITEIQIGTTVIVIGRLNGKPAVIVGSRPFPRLGSRTRAGEK